MAKTEHITPDYLIGIDLGTTHCAVAFADCKKTLNADNCQIFEIPQLVGPGKVSKRSLLPCFRYHPLKGELAENDMSLPWDNKTGVLPDEIDQVVIGEWARQLGSKSEGRLVSSAKSWLCQKRVDANTPILPWQGHDDVKKVSPVHACASYLHHIASAWNNEHPNSRFQNQDITITIPASFDESARQLTLAAAKKVGLKQVYLIEEPQAVCYHWFANHQHQSVNEKLLLICDIGGGTTDLSLIQISHTEGQPLKLKRVGVGDHLMLGGDNIDLMIAAQVQQQIALASNQTLKLAQVSQLLQQARVAKESLFSDNAPDSTKVTLLGSGRQLIGGAKSYSLDRETIHQQVLDGFFPITDINDTPHKRLSGIQEAGLPFAADPAISRHIANFILQHQQASQTALGLDSDTLSIPDAILFNGGIFNSEIFQRRLLALIKHFGQPSPTLLSNTEPDLAVAKGAVAYALARKGIFDKISGGSARSFFLLLKQQDKPDQAICLLPKGTEENQAVTLNDRTFQLTLGKPVRFDILSSTSDQSFKPAEIIHCEAPILESLRLTPLPPLMMAIDDNDERSVTVKLIATYTEIGTLEIMCVSDEASDRSTWELAFSTRQTQQPIASTLPKHFDQARQLIESAYGDNKKQADAKAVKSLRSQLEKGLGKKEDWDLVLSRALFDELYQRHKKRKRSAFHERLWFNLSGYTLRPGFGHDQDKERLQALWPLYQQGLQYKQETQSWIDWWTFWRRASGGLDEKQQTAIFQDIEAFINQKSLTSKKMQQLGKLHSLDDIIKLAASLEYLSIEIKLTLVDTLLARLKKQPLSPTYWWSLGRLASKQPAYSQNNRLNGKQVSPIIKAALEIPWQKHPHIAFAVVMISRKTATITEDIDQVLYEQVIQQLKTSKMPQRWLELMKGEITMDAQEQKRLFGEALPQGLSLAS